MDRRVAVRRVGLVMVGANLLLVAFKSAAWATSGSLAVGSEAVNSLADSVYSLIVLAGLYLTTRPPDFEHPHGHERIEPFVSLFVALGILGAGVAILWRAATSVVSGDVGSVAGPLGVAVLAGSAVAKFLLYRYCLRAGREHRSPAVVAAALDNRNDILTAGAALVGVVGAGLGYPILDPAAAAVVSLGILYTGYEIVRDNVNYLVGAAPPEDLRAEILRRALEHPDVEGAHDVVAHYVGPEIDVSLHVEVEGDLTLLKAHEIETATAGSIRELRDVDDVFVHVDPKELDEWKSENGGRTVGRFTDGESDADSTAGARFGAVARPDREIGKRADRDRPPSDVDGDRS